MNTLQQIGMKRNWLYEVVISSYNNNIPHAAPFGIKSSDFKCISIEMFKGSNTLENILTNKEFVLNHIDDPIYFYHALYDREKINFNTAKMIKAPVMTDSPSSIEARLIKAINKKQSFTIEAEVVHIHIRNKSKLTNRAKSLVLESIILSTRVSLFPEKKLDKLIRENYRVIKKVAPKSKYETIMQELMANCGC
ncbi:DUF447 family protein [Desulfobacterales bacterium HSG17]|nr:DUF447 family protein [Desulfobacterales bacterium HSG17]